jgi:hypothetical protein
MLRNVDGWLGRHLTASALWAGGTVAIAGAVGAAFADFTFAGPGAASVSAPEEHHQRGKEGEPADNLPGAQGWDQVARVLGGPLAPSVAIGVGHDPGAATMAIASTILV